MNPFKPFTLKWWQAAIYETAVFSIGLIAGSAKPQLVQRSRTALWAIFIPSCLYIFYIWLQQVKNT